MNDFTRAELELIDSAEEALQEAGLLDENGALEILEISANEEISHINEKTESKPMETTSPVRIRKDNYVKADLEFGPVFGKVISVSQNGVVVATDGGAPANLPREHVEKISFADFKANAGRTAETYANADRIHAQREKMGAALQAEAEADAQKAFDEEIEVAGDEHEVTEPSPLSKKERAIVMYHEMVADGNGKRALVLARFMDEIGLSKPGASTYHANIKLARKGWTL